VEFERVQKFTDKPLSRCPECSKGKVRRIPQASAVVFKGSGWYVTDSKSKSATSSASGSKSKSDKGESAPAESKPEGKSESKPAPSDD
jgi:putative FmdB family regulatory protein